MLRIALAAGAAVFAASFSQPAAAQSAKALVGTWAPVSAVITEPGGGKTEVFGPRPTGMLIFTADGQYAIVVRREELPKLAANSRARGTAEENQAVVAGSIAHYGRYTVDPKDGTVSFHIQGSTYPNWDGVTQKRPFTVKGDQLTYKVPAPSVSAGSGELVWRRVKPQL
jgi:Lipocalin-like domain